MTATDNPRSFLDRFERLWRKCRWMLVSERLLWTLAAFCSGFAALALMDWLFEATWAVRATLLGLLALSCAAGAATGGWLAWRGCGRQQVAALLEARFPQLGQAVRTAVQFDLPAAASPSATLLGLQRYVIRRTEALHLEAVQPTQRLLLAGGLAPAIMLPLLASGGLYEEFQTALRRAALADTPYTFVEVTPGNTLVDEGRPLRVAIDLRGRVPRTLSVESRVVGEANWKTHPFETSTDPAAPAGGVKFSAEVSHVTSPLEYRVRAGRLAPQVFQVAVRPALRLLQIRAAVVPPAHLELPAATELPADFEAVEGSQATVSVAFDRAAQSATLVVRPIGRGPAHGDTQRLPMAADGDRFVATFPLRKHAVYSIEAQGTDGAPAEANEHRIRVQADDPPELRFESPSDQLEVHALAEVPLRLQVRDDYGLRRAGIVLQINDREVELEALDLTGDPSTPKLATLAKLLPLELFELTQRDAICYYGFAEDHREDGLARSETELRYLDIRPFRRIYRADEGGGGGGGGGGPGLATLNELIGNERFLINRTLRLARAQTRGEPDLHGLDQVIGRQAFLADSARALAARVVEADIDGADLLFQAESSMLKAIDFLSQGNPSACVGLEKEALRYLIEGRNEIEVALRSGNANAVSALRRFDREQLRRLRSRAGRSQLVRELVQTLRRLALRQEDVGRRLAAETEADAPADKAVDALSADELEALTAEQLEIDLELEAVVRELEKLPGASESLRRRSVAVGEQVGELAESLERRDLGAAADQAPPLPNRLRLLARHLAGASLPDAAERLAVARDLAADLALRERALRDRLTQGIPEAADLEPLAEALLGWSGDGEAVVDILRTVVATAEAEGAETNETGRRIEALLAELGLDEARADVERVAAELAALPAEERVRAAATFAERLELTAQRLDALHRWLVEPRLEQLRALEQRGAALRAESGRTEGEAWTGRWRRNLASLVRDLEQAEAASDRVAELQAALESAGESDQEASPPAEVQTAFDEVLAELRRQIQELTLGDVFLGRDEPVPAQYRKLVEQYLRSLSNPAPAAAGQEAQP
jgi:hypothetical protein